MKAMSNAAPQGLPDSESRGPKILRFFVSLILAAVFTFIVMLAGLGYAPAAKAALAGVFDFGGRVADSTVVVVTILVGLLPIGGFIWAARRKKLTWTVLGGGGLVAAAILTWLAWDEPTIRRPLTTEELAPTFAEAQSSYEVLMRYGSGTESSEMTAFAQHKWQVELGAANPQYAAAWLEFVQKNRAALELDWNALTPQWRWLTELNSFARIGDLTPPRYDSEMMLFTVWRTLSQRGCAQATRLAQEGQGDAAMALLCPLIEVTQKLQDTSRTLMRQMIAVTVEQWAVNTAGIVLDTTAVGAEMRGRCAAALRGRGAMGARNLLLAEYAMVSAVLNESRLGDQIAMRHGDAGVLRPGLNGLSVFLFNPHATINLYGDQMYAMATLAETRNLKGLTTSSHELRRALLQSGGMKNLAGRLMIMSMADYSFEKSVERYWALEDARATLVKRLRAPVQS